MPKYLFAYHGGTRPENEADIAKEMERWGAWFATMGAAVVDGGAPVGPSKTISGAGVADNGGANPVSGYTVIQADTMEAALAHAKGCPINDTGSVEVTEIMEM